VRLLLGYERLDNAALLPTINHLYEAWALFNNFFCASLKLVGKTKIGSRYRKTYDLPQTPYQRLMASPDVNEAMKTHLTEVLGNLNPFTLKKTIDAQQRRILR
jgi:hypothetical protein